MSCPHCCNQECPTRLRRGDGFFAALLKLMVVYVVLIWGGGTLIRTGHPVAVEVGRLLHLVTFVEPTIHWIDAHGWDHVSNGLRLVSNGMPIHIG